MMSNLKHKFVLPLAAGAISLLSQVSNANAAGRGNWTLLSDPGEIRQEATVTLLQDGRVLIAGGEGYQGVLTLVEVFDPTTNSYSAAPPLGTPRDQATATLLHDGRILVVGGTANNVNPAPLRSAEIYDPAVNTWTPTGSMHQARFGQQATLLQDGRVLIMGGTPDVSTQLTTCEIWDPATGRWTFTGSMAVGRRYSSAVTLPDGNVLEAGDDSPSEIYTTSDKTWSLTAAAPYSIFATTLQSLQDGTVLAPPSTTRAKSGPGETYSQTSNSWTATNGSTTGRYYAAISTLKDGTVLIAGGCILSCSQQNVSSVVRYIPSRRAFVNVTPMNYGRESAVAVTLLDGRVLVQGGFGAQGGNPPEIFTP